MTPALALALLLSFQGADIDSRFHAEQVLLTSGGCEWFCPQSADWARQHLRVFGWPRDDRRAVRLAIVIKHSGDAGLALQVLPQVERLRHLPQVYAIYLDGLLMALGRAQRYGTQLQEVSPGWWGLAAPVEDIRQLDQRREEIGLEPVFLYLLEANVAFAEMERPE